MGYDLHLEEAEVPSDSELKEEAYDSDDSDIYDVLMTCILRKTLHCHCFLNKDCKSHFLVTTQSLVLYQ